MHRRRGRRAHARWCRPRDSRPPASRGGRGRRRRHAGLSDKHRQRGDQAHACSRLACNSGSRLTRRGGRGGAETIRPGPAGSATSARARCHRPRDSRPPASVGGAPQAAHRAQQDAPPARARVATARATPGPAPRVAGGAPQAAHRAQRDAPPRRAPGPRAQPPPTRHQPPPRAAGGAPQVARRAQRNALPTRAPAHTRDCRPHEPQPPPRPPAACERSGTRRHRGDRAQARGLPPTRVQPRDSSPRPARRTAIAADARATKQTSPRPHGNGNAQSRRWPKAAASSPPAATTDE